MGRARLLKEGAIPASFTAFPMRLMVAAPKGGPKTQAAGWLRETTRSRSQAPMVQPTR